ncbi:DMT family transporter [Synechococcus sp. A15-44]|uniref:DMT family transporter n=1 Tax=Synechococcus sp. A15-44 TaxID=1050646 RepID=UPI00164622E9|nr:DMT family transporter [Synechococcus sp. A15-44]QNI64359.1 drug/metabolite transporter (DMT) superfamily efflux protein [Synechococcus sp. A15-44]
MTGVLAALGAAMAWTGASALWRSLSGRITAIRLNAMKNGLASLLFLPVLLTLPRDCAPHAVVLLLLSGLIGIAAGDSFYLGALRRLGTRRTLTVEASGPVLASIAGVLVMGDSLGVRNAVGALLVSSAVVLIALQAKEKSQHKPHAFDSELGPGLLLALTAVICGLSGAFLARHVLLSSDLTPLQTAAIRLLGGWVGLLPLLKGIWSQAALSRREQWKLVIATVIGTNGGILLQQVVLQSMPVGEGVTLMATAPVIALFVGRMEGDPIQLSGVAAAGLALAGVACTSL